MGFIRSALVALITVLCSYPAIAGTGQGPMQKIDDSGLNTDNHGGVDPVEICQARCVSAFILCVGKGMPAARCELEKAECYARCSMNE